MGIVFWGSSSTIREEVANGLRTFKLTYSLMWICEVANATSLSPVSTYQAKIQNPELVTHELLSLASKVLKF